MEVERGGTVWNIVIVTVEIWTSSKEGITTEIESGGEAWTASHTPKIHLQTRLTGADQSTGGGTMASEHIPSKAEVITAVLPGIEAMREMSTSLLAAVVSIHGSLAAWRQ